MKLWIDDIRTPPRKGWVWAKTSARAIAILEKNSKNIEYVSFDHDLSYGDEAYDVANWIEAAAEEGKICRFKWGVHSMNIVGKQRITAAMSSAEKFWAR